MTSRPAAAGPRPGPELGPEPVLQEQHVIYWRYVDHYLKRVRYPYPECTSACPHLKATRQLQGGEGEGKDEGTPPSDPPRVALVRHRVVGGPRDQIIATVADRVSELLRAHRSLLTQLWQTKASLVQYLGSQPSLLPPAGSAGVALVLRQETTGSSDGLSLVERQQLYWLARAAAGVGVQLAVHVLPNDAQLHTLSASCDPDRLQSVVPAPPPAAPQEFPPALYSECAAHPAHHLILLLYQRGVYELAPLHVQGPPRPETEAHSPLQHIPTLTWHVMPHTLQPQVVYAHLPRSALHPPRVAAAATLSRILVPDALATEMVNLHTVAIDVLRLANSSTRELLFELRYAPASQRTGDVAPSLGAATDHASARDPQRYVVLVSEQLAPPAPGGVAVPLSVARYTPASGEPVVLSFSYNMHAHYAASGNQVARAYVVELSECKLPSIPQLLSECKRAVSEVQPARV